DNAREPVRGLLKALAWARMGPRQSDPAPLAFRMHQFFRNVSGLWACCNPHCTEAPRQQDGPEPVGRLYPSPRLICPCGARVLDLLVCSHCGEVYLGGYRQREAQGAEYLVHDQPEFERIGRRQAPDRRYGHYAVFWPTPEEPACLTQWGQGIRYHGNNTPVRRYWVQAHLEPRT